MNFSLSMLDKNILNSICSFLHADAELFVVGGYLRDKFFKKESFDIDFIVKGQNAIELAQKFAQKTGRFFILLDEEHEIARVVDVDKEHYFDFARCEDDDVEKDLARRDISINAIAIKVFPNFQILDNFGGISDLENKKIKIISEKNIIDDPLRIFRIFRFASMLDFEIEEESLNCAKKHYKLINNVAKERVLTELFKFFEGEESSKYLHIMKEIGLLYELFEILEKEAHVPPNTHHHLKLIDHSIETVHQLEMNLKNVNEFVKNKVNSYQVPNVKYLSLLKLACLLHDVGKYSTWTIEENGRHRFINHDSVGAELLKPILKEMKFSKAQIKYITTLVKNHIYPSQLARENGETNEKAIHRMFRKIEDCTVDVLLLAMADRLSAQGPAITKEITETNIRVLNSYLKMYEEFSQNSKPLPKLIDGHEIASLLNIEKGKELGIVINQIKEAQLSGEINTKEDAIKFILKNK